MTATDILEEFFDEILQLPPDAKDWLIALWDATQFLDDVADKDDIPRHQFDNAINQLLVAMPANKFFATHAVQLLSSVAVVCCQMAGIRFSGTLE